MAGVNCRPPLFTTPPMPSARCPASNETASLRTQFPCQFKILRTNAGLSLQVQGARGSKHRSDKHIIYGTSWAAKNAPDPQFAACQGRRWVRAQAGVYATRKPLVLRRASVFGTGPTIYDRVCQAGRQARLLRARAPKSGTAPHGLLICINCNYALGDTVTLFLLWVLGVGNAVSQ